MKVNSTKSRYSLFIKEKQAIAKGIVLLAILFVTSISSFASRAMTDETGRRVTLPDHVHRIVCLTPSVTNTVYSIGAGQEVVGITDYTFYPPEARQKSSVGDILRPSMERIAVLHPDLVIGVSTLNSADTIRAIERMGVPVFLVNAVGLQGLYSSIENIGRAVGHEVQASALVAQLQARERKVRIDAASGKHPSVFLAISIDPCITAGRRAFITELLSAAGAHPVTGDIDKEWINISIEAIVPRNPDFVLLMKNSPFGLNQLRNRPGWSSLSSVRNGRVLMVDDRLQYPSPVAFDALEEFARQLRTASAH